MTEQKVTHAGFRLALLATALPATVGIALFDDQVRDGWWPAALVAFVVSLVAGAVLCGAEAAIEMIEDDDLEDAS